MAGLLKFTDTSANPESFAYTTSDICGKGVLGQADVPGLTAEQQQRKTEELVRKVVMPLVNKNADDTCTVSTYDTDADGKVNAAAEADKWTAPRNFSILDADATNEGAAVPVDGSGAVTLPLPSTIKANLTGDVTGNVTGTHYGPVYGNVSGGAVTAIRLATARMLNVTDADGTNTGTGATFNGSGNATVKLPAAIKADITGNLTGAVTGNVTGNASGNAGTATKLATARTLNVTDADGTHTGVGASFDGSGNATMKLPGVIGAAIIGDVNGNAASADKWKTARYFTVKDADSTNSGVASSADGSAAVTLNLPSTIKAAITGNVTGNVSGSAGSCTGNAATATMAGACYGNAATATKLETARSITIGEKTNSFDGSAAISFSLADAGAAATSHTHGAATTSANGFMSAADKTKLDGVEAGAEVNDVTSVAGKTGAVTLGPADVGAAEATHIHGNLTNDGKIGTASGKVIMTGTGGAVEAKSIAEAGIAGKTTIRVLYDGYPYIDELANNVEYRFPCRPAAAPGMTIPAISALSEEFVCAVTFKAPNSTAPVITNNSGYTLKYAGLDVSGGVWTPVAETVYRMSIVFDSINVNIYVSGVSA